MQQSQQQQKKYKRHLSLVLVLVFLFLLGAAQVIADDRLTSTIFLSVNIQPQLVAFNRSSSKAKSQSIAANYWAAQDIPTREHAKMRQCNILASRW